MPELLHLREQQKASELNQLPELIQTPGTAQGPHNWPWGGTSREKMAPSKGSKPRNPSKGS